MEKWYTAVGKVCVCLFGVISYVLYFHTMFHFRKADSDINNFRIWEDLYGRNFTFFLFSVVNYKLNQGQNPEISFFDIKPELRLVFFIRIITNTLTQLFMALALASSSRTSAPIAILSASIPVCRFISL